MIQKHQLACGCGLRLKLTADTRLFLSLYCDRCQCVVFNQQTTQAEMDGEAANIAVGETIMISSDDVALEQENKIINDYRIIKKLGEGCMGQVLLACQMNTQETVVIKMLKIDTMSQAERDRLVDYFCREVFVLKDVDHPYIVRFKGYGNSEGVPYLVMEYVDGEDLSVILSRGPLKLSQAISIVYNLAAALEYAESKKLVHRDIKPSNIIIAKNKGIPKLIDFGMAKIVGEYSYALTKSGALLGTILYMPQEQIQDAKRVDHRADIYALGATFYHMLSGKPPFHELADRGGMPLLRSMLANKLTPLRQICPQLPQPICDIVARAMSFLPENRYQSATELKRDLKGFLTSGKS
jgi:serine/threonine-protein kinase